MATTNRTVIDPAEDPRLPPNDIPEYLFTVAQRWSDKSPTSPSLRGFEACSSGLVPSKENPDAFPASLLHLEVFYDNYCGIMNFPLTFKTNTHAHFVGLFSTRKLAEREAELLRVGTDTEYRVYCVRGAELREMGVSVIRGRAIVTIGRPNDRRVVHTDHVIGEEFLVWGRVPVEAVLGSWGADGVMQYARSKLILVLHIHMHVDLTCEIVRQEAARLRGPSKRFDYIQNYLPGPEATAKEAFAWPNSLPSRSQDRGSASTCLQPSKNVHPRLLGLPPPPPLQATPAPDTTMVRRLPGLLATAPSLMQQQRLYQSPYGGSTMNPSFNAQAVKNLVSAEHPAVTKLD
ncbi:MAG: hypothetical protein CL912_22770 [Deltaproteobacteria bacterium]|nr:hypothetical protein [Deltaproteobacteria bacterium]